MAIGWIKYTFFLTFMKFQALKLTKLFFLFQHFPFGFFITGSFSWQTIWKLTFFPFVNGFFVSFQNLPFFNWTLLSSSLNQYFTNNPNPFFRHRKDDENGVANFLLKYYCIFNKHVLWCKYYILFSVQLSLIESAVLVYAAARLARLLRVRRLQRLFNILFCELKRQILVLVNIYYA